MYKKIITSLFLLFFFLMQIIVPTNIAQASTNQDLTFGTTVTGNITSTNEQDTYKIVLPNAGKIDINMLSPIYRVYLSLKDTAGNEVLNGDILGDEQTPKVWAASADLEPGTYYLSVLKSYSYTGKYTLEVNFAAINNNDLEPNNGTLIAQPLDLNSNPITGYVSWNDNQDTYKVVLPKAGKISINMISQIYRTYLSLRDTVGNEVLSGDILGDEQTPKVWEASADLEPGTYYLSVLKSYSYTGKYTLGVNFTAINNNDVEPNNGSLTAQLMDLNSNPITGYISWNDNQDTYKIVLPKAGKININMISQLYRVYLSLKDTAGNEILNGDMLGDAQNPKTWSRSVDLDAGTYYLSVLKSYSYTGKYTLGVTSAVEPVPVNKLTLTILLKVNSSMNFRALVNPSNAANNAVVWSSNKSSVVRVDGSGNIKALAPGTAVITATSKGNKSSASITIIVTK